jgi:hypothetical protein
MSSDGTVSAAPRGQGALLLVAVVLGVVLGWLGAKPLSFLGVGNVLIWAIGVVALGTRPGTAPGKVLRLGLFGFVLGVSFMCFDYSGADALSTKLVPFAVIGLFCAACAVALGALVHVVLSMRAARRDGSRTS